MCIRHRKNLFYYISILFSIDIYMYEKLCSIRAMFCNELSYKKLNRFNSVKMRNIKKGIGLIDAVLYKFLYSNKNVTKEHVVSIMNNKNGTHFTRQAFDSKANNVTIVPLENILKNAREFFYLNYKNNDDLRLASFDGTYNNNKSNKESLNMGIYDITHEVPIDLKSYGEQGKNKEVQSSMDYIENNKDKLKDCIIVADRAYFSYKFMNYLINNGYKFIIRVKGDGAILNDKKVIYKSNPKYDEINNIKPNVRIIECIGTIKKIIYPATSKRHLMKRVIEVENNCFLVTNLLDVEKYSDDRILKHYRSRWDIEVFFKHLKYNFKFQHMKEKYEDEHKKMYVMELILIYIAKIIEKEFIIQYKQKKNLKKDVKIQINKSNLVKGIYDYLLCDLLYGTLTKEKLDQFCSAYIKIITNKEGRSFPRTSKTPFTKWYVKGYSDQSKYMRIVDAIQNNKVDELEKTLKVFANRIISIDGIEIT